MTCMYRKNWYYILSIICISHIYFQNGRFCFITWVLEWCLVSTFLVLLIFSLSHRHDLSCISYDELHLIFTIFICEVLSHKSKMQDVLSIYMDNEETHKYKQFLFVLCWVVGELLVLTIVSWYLSRSLCVSRSVVSDKWKWKRELLQQRK